MQYANVANTIKCHMESMIWIRIRLLKSTEVTRNLANVSDFNQPQESYDGFSELIESMIEYWEFLFFISFHSYVILFF